MPELSFAGLLGVAVVAFAAPVLLELLGLRRLPAVVVEILAGIVIGPAVLGWVRPDAAVDVVAFLGLAFLLFLAGLEVDLRGLRGDRLRVAAAGFAASLVLAAMVALGLAAIGLVADPPVVAIALLATSLGVVIPTLKDAGVAEGEFGQLVLASASIADVGAIIALSLAFSSGGSGPAATLVLIGLFVILLGLLAAAVLGAERWGRLSDTLVALQDTTARIRLRGAFLLLVALALVAERLGLEVILGAFAAGAIVALVDRDERMTHPAFHDRLEAVGYGIFVPVFFVASGLRFDLDALFASASSLAMVPVFVAALLLVRGLPAMLYRDRLSHRQVTAAALLQATSLPFIVTTTMIGTELGVLDPATAASLVSAGLLSVLIFPLVASTLLAPASPSSATNLPRGR